MEVLVGHMGGPFWARRDDGAWSIPKGEYDSDEDALAAAEREFAEELGIAAPAGARIELGEVRQPSGKVVTVWAVEAEVDLAGFQPGTFELEWPRGSRRIRTFPEIDRAEWFDLDTARVKLVSGQVAFLDRLAELG